MFLLIQKNSKNWNISSLPGSPHQSLKKQKNQILQEELKLSDSELLQANKYYQRRSDFFSASYSGEWLFLGIWKRKIGVDIEVIKPRSTPLLQKYTSELLLHFGIADQKYFYLLRTAKEAVLKASDSENLDLIETIQLIKIEKSSEQIGTITFDWNLSFHFQGEIWQVKSWENWEIAYSICEK